MNKGHSYFELLDAFREPGCPICKLVLKDSRGYLDHLLYESVLDVPTRMELMDSFGLCSWHTWQVPVLPPICSPDTGFSIFASDLLRKFSLLAVAITEGSHQKRGLKSFFRRKASRFLSKIKEQACPACLHVGQFESYRLKELAEFIDEAEFRQAYEASQGICLPHFFLLEKNYSSHSNFPLLFKLQLAKAQFLRDALEEFIRKQDHRFQHGITPAEAKAWRVAMEFLAGKPGVFANEMGHDLLQRARIKNIWADEVSVAPVLAGRLTVKGLIDEIKAAKEVTFYLRQPLPSDLLNELKVSASRKSHPTIEAVVEDFDDIEYLCSLHVLGFSIFYGLGLPSLPVVFLGQHRGFLLGGGQSSSLKPLKNAEDIYFGLLWRRFASAVLLCGSVKEVDIKSNLFCLVVEGGGERWCRVKGSATKALPAVGAKIEIFAWEKWGSQVLEVIDLKKTTNC